MVLRALHVPPFEPLSGLDLQLLCLKIAFHLAVFAYRFGVSELFALSMDTVLLRFGEEDRVVHLLPNTAFQPKVLVKTFVYRPLVLEAFHPPRQLWLLAVLVMPQVFFLFIVPSTCLLVVIP